MTGRPTDKVYYISDAYWYRESSHKNSAVYLKSFPHSVTDGLTSWQTNRQIEL